MSIWQWYQRKVNERTVKRIRTKSGTMWGMDMVILRTKGRKSGRPRETPLCWFPDDDGWLIVASGGGKGNPDWYANLAAHPDSVAVERHGQQPVPVTPVVLAGSERQAAWNAVVSAQPRYAKYQKKATREYPVVRLVAA
ncbi:nitroreductase family deazaflavin-dependent oxidoreductase [Gordonia westfalica]|uniref:Nitroreductase family deazaflavin-dependent oxidoreductase n=1 Tax=Gordonia westfalica TaxID=158898 RepID=A0ABU2GPW6_9ACTN|nr:nitroreductase family deazaflavin-dependent oxidoreductase [Gordonia westfalica]MDS1113507.1 nitroreductase family deazaflavin-dependent oxidoreductase [Gordonia westfalica]